MPRLPLQAVLGLSFALVVGLALGAVDYLNQSRQARADGAESFGIGTYVASITGRYTDMKAVQAAEAERAALRATTIRELLPPAPEGWTRRAWAAEDAARLDPRYDMAKDDFIPDAMKNDGTLQTLGALDKAAVERRDRDEVYVYQNAGEVVAMRLHLSKGTPPGMSGAALKIAAANLRATRSGFGFAMVGGVAFREEHGPAQDGKAHPDKARVFTGNLGPDLTVTVRARAGDDAILLLLRAIDYDRLNRMLETPVPGVGNRAPVLDPEISRLLAEAALVRDDAAMRKAADEAIRRLQRFGVPSRTEALRLLLEASGETDPGFAAWLTAMAAPEPEPARQEAALADAPAAGGFLSRLGGFFRGGGSGGAKKEPVTFTCASRKGFKNCSVAD